VQAEYLDLRAFPVNLRPVAAEYACANDAKTACEFTAWRSPAGLSIPVEGNLFGQPETRR
jgi:hypothetical protein